MIDEIVQICLNRNVYYIDPLKTINKDIDLNVTENLSNDIFFTLSVYFIIYTYISTDYA